MFAVCSLQQFELEPVKGFILPFKISVLPGKMLGYLPVYATREDALEAFSGAQLMEVQLMGQVETGGARQPREEKQ